MSPCKIRHGGSRGKKTNFNFKGREWQTTQSVWKLIKLINNKKTMKNITKSLVMIVAVAALAIGGTVAYFSDTETSARNTISAGTIDISVDSQNP